jgi:hypothetical protein
VKEPIETLIGSYLDRFIGLKYKSKIDHLLTQKNVKKNDFLIISLTNALYLKLSFHLLPFYLGGENFIIIATDISELKKKENELLKLHRLLEQRFDEIKKLRINLINANIVEKAGNIELAKTNKKLVKEIAKHKLIEAELKQKLKKATR